MSVKFNVDGYVEPMKPRMAGIAIGAVLILVSVGLGFAWSVCFALPLGLVGLMMVANEKGQRRYRVTSSKLLIEDEPLIRGFVIGPIRSRITWDQVESVDRAGQAVKMVTRGGETLVLGEGGTDQELERFLGRIRVSMED